MLPSKTDRLLTASIAVLVGALIWVVLDAMNQRIVAVGDTAPDFHIAADNGKTITRTDFGGKLLVLNFWATWCAPCVQELPSLNAFSERMRARGVVVVAISVDKNEEAYRRFLKRVNVGFLTARDPEANISSEYGTFKYPETYVIDSSGEVVEKFIGDENWMDPRILERIERRL